MHEAGHFVMGAILGVPMGDITMVASKVRGAFVSADKAADWVREIPGD